MSRFSKIWGEQGQNIGGDVEILDSDSDLKASKSKQKSEKKALHPVRVMSKIYMQRKTKATDTTVIERNHKPQKLIRILKTWARSLSVRDL